jgi:predicted enzyme related to lactoylglutathione lyase
MSKVIHFELPADNIERAQKFYTKIFGWQFQKWDGPTPYWMIVTGPTEQPGINGGMMPRPAPGAGVVNTIGVTSVDDMTAAVEANGGKIILPKMAIPGVGWLAYFTDTEGNQFGVIQNDTSAK